MNQYVALWRTGDRDLFWHVGLSFDEFKQTTNDFHKLGYRITSLDVSDEGLFTAIWKRGDYAQFWVRVNSDDIDGQIKHFDKKGCRMEYIAHENGQVTMVFKPGSGDHFYCFGKDFESFKKLDKKHFDHGLRIHWVAIGKDDPTISAIWRPGTGAQFCYLTASWNEFSELNNAHKEGGLFLSCLHKMHDPGRYIGLVHPGTGSQEFDFTSHEGIVEQNAKWAKKGMELKVIRRLHYNSGGLFPDLDGFER